MREEYLVNLIHTGHIESKNDSMKVAASHLPDKLVLIDSTMR